MSDFDYDEFLNEAEQILEETSPENMTSATPEKEYFFSDLQNKKLAANTLRSYENQYDKLIKALNKPIHSASEDLLFKTVQNLSTNNNSQASILNIAIMVRMLYNLKVDNLLKRRTELKKNIASSTVKKNMQLGNILPNIEEFDEYIEYTFNNKRYPEFIVNYLLRHFVVRNLDLVFDVVKRRSDVTDDKNYMYVMKDKIKYIRNLYKTAGVYGTKEEIITDKRFRTALLALKGLPIVPKPDSSGYYVKKYSFQQLGEGNVAKIVINHYRVKGDLKKLKEISCSRGTDLATIATSYNIQDC